MKKLGRAEKIAKTIKNKNLTEMSESKAELLGYPAAEGNECHRRSRYKRFYPNRGKTGKFYTINWRQDAIEFTNLNPVIQERFRELLLVVYGWTPPRFDAKWRIRIIKKAIVLDVLSLSALCSRSWRIPEIILNGNEQLKSAWIRGYADGDGTVGRTVKLDSVNFSGIQKVHEMLKSLGIESSFLGPYSHGRCRISIGKNSLKTYLEKIGFNHPQKLSRLVNLVQHHSNGAPGGI